MDTSRRHFLGSSSLLATTLLAQKAYSSSGLSLLSPSLPIDVTNDPIMNVNQAQSTEFNGDEIDRPHDILWNLDGYLKSKGGEPRVSEDVDVVVVGGGLGGLLSAYYLKNQKTVLLEQASQVGGNSKGENFNGSLYSTGGAYFCVPDTGSSTETLLKDLGLLNEAKLESETTVFYKNKFFDHFWMGSTDPQKKRSIQTFVSLLKNILENSYPDIPHDSFSNITRSQLNSLDSISFQQWLSEHAPDLSEHVKEYCQLYAWSSFVGSIDEISAAQMLNFIAAETGGILSLPGGNSRIAQELYKSLIKTSGTNSVRSGCFVLRVLHKEDWVEVLYEDASRKLKKIKAKKCIMAAPKFVAKHLLPQLPFEQKKLMESMTYRGYIVANVILNKSIQSPSYELYCIEGQMPESPRALKPPLRAFTDVCFGTWAQEEKVTNSVLTIYKALPMDGARQFLFSPFAHDKNKKVVEEGVVSIVESLGLKSDDILGLRMTRWGHSMPLAQVGFIANGVPEKMNQPLGSRIYFVNQDNWANPCFEAAHSEARNLKF